MSKKLSRTQLGSVLLCVLLSSTWIETCLLNTERTVYKKTLNGTSTLLFCNITILLRIHFVDSVSGLKTCYLCRPR